MTDNESMPFIPSTLSRSLAATGKTAFLAREWMLARLAGTPPLRIAMSAGRVEWEDQIRWGLARTAHRVDFLDLEAVDLQGYDLVVPLTVPHLQFCDEHRDRLPNTRWPIPSASTVDLFDDKAAFNQAVIEAGLGRTIPRATDELSYPYILKKRHDEFARHCYLIHGPEDQALHADVDGDPEYIKQPFIAGPCEYATHLLLDRGQILASLNIRYRFASEFPIKGQTSLVSKSVCRCPHLELFREMLDALEFNGLCCVNYKPSADGPKVLEINPRFGGSLARFFFAMLRHLPPTES